jgi:hypothetical protein
MKDHDRLYHVEMMLRTLGKLRVPYEGGTRNCLDVDMGEKKILTELLVAEYTKLGGCFTVTEGPA